MTAAIKWLFIGILTISQFLPLQTQSTSSAKMPANTQKGISFAAWTSHDYLSSDSDQSLAELRATGADWISLIVTQYQAKTDSTSIHPTGSTPSDVSLVHAIQAAHQLGLKVMLKPHVDLNDDPAHWRGQIGQGLSSSLWPVWFASYQGFILHYARLAADNSVEQFCAGTELSKTQNRGSDWRQVISAVRQVYAGKLVYAANFGDELGLGWWDAVDIIGVDAYYALAARPNPSLSALRMAWKPYTLYLSALAAKTGKPILFTEIGYRSIQGAAISPADYKNTAPADLQEQQNAYQAAFQSVVNQPWFAGMYWWTWTVDPQAGGPGDLDYTPHQKPAEDVLRTWYGGEKDADQASEQ